jgi:hypothetical protein
MAPGHSLRHLVAASALALLSLAATLAAIEISLPVRQPQSTYRAWREASFTYLEDPETDWRLEPRAYPWGQVNRYGFRGPEIPPEKRPGTCRVLVLGGSAAFDLWKRDGETWSDQLQQRRGQALPCRVEVMNTGTPGYSTWQAARLLESRLLRWKPDLASRTAMSNGARSTTSTAASTMPGSGPAIRPRGRSIATSPGRSGTRS